MDKSNFLLYKDFKSTIDILTDEQAGKLIKAVFSYVNGRVEPNFKDGMLIVAFNVLKSQLERDLIKYKLIVERNQINGAKGGRPKNNPDDDIKPNKPNGLNKTQVDTEKPKKADSDSDSVRDSVSDNDMKDKKIIKETSYFSNIELNLIFKDFLQLRKKLKAVNSERAIKTLLTKLDELSNFDDDIKIKIIEQSIMNSYKGVFPLKENNNYKPKNKGFKTQAQLRDERKAEQFEKLAKERGLID